MPSAVNEWIAKSDADFRSAQRLLRARKEAADDEGLRFLTRGAVVFRYPGANATRDEAKRAITLARVLRKALLGLI